MEVGSVRIKDIRVIVSCPGRNYVTVKILTDQDGLYGVGDATLAGRELAVAHLIESHLGPFLIGQDPSRIEYLWEYIYRGTYWRGGPVTMTALAGIDTALWDLKGKALGVPVYSLLGGKTRDSSLVYGKASGSTPEDVEDALRQLIDEGYKAVRVQVGMSGRGVPGHTYGVYRYGKLTSGYAQFRAPIELPVDAAGEALPWEERWEPEPYIKAVVGLFDHLRSTFGHTVELMHDVHHRLSPSQAVTLARALEPHDLFFLEDPIAPEYPRGLAHLRSHTATPLALGELFTSKWEFEPLLSGKLIDYARVDLGHVGGITEARKIAALAEACGIRMAWHCPTDISPISHAASAHLGLSIPNFGIQEWVPLPDATLEVFSGHPEFRDGHVVISDKPGLGCDIDEARAKKTTYKRTYTPVLRRLDGSVGNW